VRRRERRLGGGIEAYGGMLERFVRREETTDGAPFRRYWIS
jgi:hypothetical protein